MKTRHGKRRNKSHKLHGKQGVETVRSGKTRIGERASPNFVACIDKRSRYYKRYLELHSTFIAQAPGHEQLCRTLASLLLQRELLDAALVKGERVNSLDLVRVSDAISRLHRDLDEIEQRNKPQDDDPDDPIAYAKRRRAA